MIKIAAIVSLLLVGSTLCAASTSCDACGSECFSACGTRYFKICCYNYLSHRRGQDNFAFWSENLHDMNTDSAQSPKMALFLIEDIPEPWSFLLNDFKPYQFDDNVDNLLQFAYDV